MHSNETHDDGGYVCWNGLRGFHLLLYHLCFMVGLASEIPPSWYQSQVISSSSPVTHSYSAVRKSHLTVLAETDRPS
jgi:hypothetical protein